MGTSNQLHAAQHDIDAMARYWSRRKREFLWLASEIFLTFVEPACLYNEEPMLDHTALSAIATDWMVFDFPFYEGRTLLEEYVEHPPHDVSDASRARLREIADTHLFSQFAIRSKDPATHTCTLEDLASCRRFDVFDQTLCATDHWRNGTIAERIARVDERWLHIGMVHLYDRAAASVAGARYTNYLNRNTSAISTFTDSFYLHLLRDVIGIDGVLRDSASVTMRDR